MKQLFWVLFLLVCTSGELYSQLYIGGSVGNAFINKDLDDVNGDDFNVDEKTDIVVKGSNFNYYITVSGGSSGAAAAGSLPTG